MGTEQFGNAPLAAGNYTDWHGIMPTIDHPSRVYNVWVNGNEYFCYRGDTAQLNDILSKFAENLSPVREVFILPGAGSRKTFDGETIEYDWMLHIRGGISKAVGGDSLALDQYPTLSIYPEEKLQLEDIRVPAGITLLDIHDLRERYRDAIASDDYHARGHASSLWAGADPYNPDAAAALAALLEDTDGWVQRMAAHALGRMGTVAEPYVPALRASMAQSDKAGVRKMFRTTIKDIEKSKPAPAESVATFERQVTVIRQFVEAHRQQQIIVPDDGVLRFPPSPFQ
jgi:hypothetical protein